jgi:hypothetical protein
LTLGNKKNVDILVRNGNRIQTIDVKGVQGAAFVVGDVADKLDDPAHYFVFVAFAKDAITDHHPNNANNVLFKDLQPLSRQYRNTEYQRSSVVKKRVRRWTRIKRMNADFLT